MILFIYVSCWSKLIKKLDYSIARSAYARVWKSDRETWYYSYATSVSDWISTPRDRVPTCPGGRKVARQWHRALPGLRGRAQPG